jgi:ferredoxin-NADP reductase
MPEYHFPLKDRKEVADGTMAFWFDTAGQNFTFEPGQNIDIFLPDAPESGASSDQMHTFSFASSPHHTDHFRITTRMRDSRFKNTLKTLQIGTPLRCVGPQGNMVLHEDASKPGVFLAGGIGITPFRSMIEWAAHEHLPHTLHLFYSNRTKSSTTYHDDFVEWERANPNFHYHPTLTDEKPDDWPYETGYIDATMLTKHLNDLTKPIFYIAGPPGMVGAMRKMLLEAKVSRDNIKIESFTGY